MISRASAFALPCVVSVLTCKQNTTDGDRDMRKAVLMLCALILTGCDGKTEAFGITIGGKLQEVRDKQIVKKEELVPSSGHFLVVDLTKAPKNEAGQQARYSVTSFNGEIIGVTADLDDDPGDYYNSFVSYAKQKLGEPIATNQSIMDKSAVNSIPYGCVVQHTCPTANYTIFRKGNVSAMVSSGDKTTKIMFDSDKIKDALK